MDARHFDQLTRSMAARASRRGLLKGALATMAASVLQTVAPRSAGLASPDHTATETPRYQSSNTLQYFALGDSVASGHGLGTDCKECLRSARAYPFRLTASLENRGFDVATHHFACSGATSASQGKHQLGDQVTQVLSVLSPSNPYTLVTITIGANDFHWLERDFLQRLTEQSDAAFESMLTDVSKNIRENVTAQVNRLLEANPNLGIIITDYYNPFDPTLLFGENWIDLVNPFRLAQTWSWWFPTQAAKDYLQAKFMGFPIVDTVLGAKLGIALKAELYQIVARMDRMISAINTALSLVSKNSYDSQRVQMTSTVRQTFASHPSTCLFPLDGASSWIQSLAGSDSNSVKCAVGGLAGELLRGDCFHPNAIGAQAIATEGLNPALRMLATLGLQPNIQLQSESSASATCDGLLCSGQCVDWKSDSSNCGQCGRMCAPGTCNAGRCSGAATCQEPLALCGASCRNLQTNSLHCGACGNDCGENACIAEVCQDSPSECGAGQSSCDEACVDFRTDVANCGECGHVCPNSQCVEGECLSDFTCSADADCPAGACCGDTCIDLFGNNDQHCGRCDHVCSQFDGERCCGGECVDSLSDMTNCGFCGTVCDDGATCAAGECVPLTQSTNGRIIARTVTPSGDPLLGSGYVLLAGNRLVKQQNDRSSGLDADGVVDGLTVFEDLSPGQYSLYVGPSDENWQYVGTEKLYSVSVTADETTEVTIVMDTNGATIRFIGVYPDGTDVDANDFVWIDPRITLRPINAWAPFGQVDADAYNFETLYPGMYGAGDWSFDAYYIYNGTTIWVELGRVFTTYSGQTTEVRVRVLEDFDVNRYGTLEILTIDAESGEQVTRVAHYLKTEIPGDYDRQLVDGDDIDGLAADNYADGHVIFTSLKPGQYSVQTRTLSDAPVQYEDPVEWHPVTIAADKTNFLTIALVRSMSVQQSSTEKCGDSQIDCEGICIDPLTDVHNCGGCSRPCSDDQSCVDGVCVGPASPVPTEIQVPDEPEADPPAAEELPEETPLEVPDIPDEALPEVPNDPEVEPTETPTSGDASEPAEGATPEGVGQGVA